MAPVLKTPEAGTILPTDSEIVSERSEAVGEARSADVTGLLQAWGRGEAGAGEGLIAAVYGELHRQAARRLRRERPNHTLSPTALVHEAYLRLVDQRHVDWQGRSHFFAVAASMMRRVLLDHARRRRAGKRGGAWHRVSWDEALPADGEGHEDVIAVDEALAQLAAVDPDKARLVELRFFGGLTIEEAADVLGVSVATLTREWRLARAWLFRRLRGREGSRTGVRRTP